MSHDTCKRLINGLINPSSNELIPLEIWKRRRSSFFLYMDKILLRIPCDSGQHSNLENYLEEKQQNKQNPNKSNQQNYKLQCKNNFECYWRICWWKKRPSGAKQGHHLLLAGILTFSMAMKSPMTSCFPAWKGPATWAFLDFLLTHSHLLEAITKGSA